MSTSDFCPRRRHRDRPRRSRRPSPRTIDGVARSRRVRRLLRREIAPPYRTHYIEGVPAPTEAIRMRGFKANRPCAVSAGAEAAAMVDLADLKIERLTSLLGYVMRTCSRLFLVVLVDKT